VKLGYNEHAWDRPKLTICDQKFQLYSFINDIVKIDSRTWSFCLYKYVQNGLSYPGKQGNWTQAVLKEMIS
jgi:hypothetical protein